MLKSLAIVAGVVFATPALADCTLDVEQAGNTVHLSRVCDGVHKDDGYKKFSPKDHSCEISIIDEVEKVDELGSLVHTHCGNKKSTLVLQLTDYGKTLLITNPENW